MAGYDPLTRGEPDIAVRPVSSDPEAVHGYGWVRFAGVMVMVAGMLNFIYGWRSRSGQEPSGAAGSAFSRRE